MAGEASRETEVAVARVDAADGAVRWRVALPGEGAARDAQVVVQGLLADGDTAWVVALEGGDTRPAACRAYGLDARAGRVRFARRLPLAGGALAACALARDGPLLLVGRGAEGLTLLDACDGATRAEYAVPGLLLAPLALREGAAFVLTSADAAATRAWDDDPAPAVLRALDARTGAERWRASMPVWPGEPQFAGPWALVQTAGRAVAALDRATGAVAWRWSPGDAVEPLLAPRDAPRWLLAPSARGVRAIDLAHPARAPGDARGATVVRGRVVAASVPWRAPPRAVRVGDRVVPVGPGGRFAARVEGAGHVAIAARLDGVAPAHPRRDGCASGGQARVPLDGGAHEVTLRVSFGGCE